MLLRVEFQTLKRLPKTNWILFTVHTCATATVHAANMDCPAE